MVENLTQVADQNKVQIASLEKRVKEKEKKLQIQDEKIIDL